MLKKLLREMYLLPRGEQRALVGVTFLLLLSLLIRIGVQLLPGREPAGVEEFEREARAIMAAFVRADSLDQVRADSLRQVRTISYAYSAYYASQGSKRQASEPININRADSVQLLPLPGIGPVFAGRIFRYRKLLGGYVNVDQLGEVYGIPAETIELIRAQVYIDSSAIRKIRIDSATFGELLRHPYLEYEQVKALVEYRDFKGEISSVFELKANHILADSTLYKIDGYFDYR
jgi:DNA uptake protein ComE-like DNA-binding protein